MPDLFGAPEGQTVLKDARGRMEVLNLAELPSLMASLPEPA